MDVRKYARHIPLLREAIEFGGFASYAISAIFGATAMIVIWSFFVQYPQVALAASAVFAFYSLQAADFALRWWQRDDLRSSLVIGSIEPIIDKNDDGTVNIFVRYLITNNSCHEVAFRTDDEIISAGDKHAVSKCQSGASIIAAKETLGMQTDPVKSLQCGTSEFITLKSSSRFGLAKQDMNIRWWSMIELDLPAPVGTAHFAGWRVQRNDFERLYV